MNGGFDTSELRELAFDFGKVSARTVPVMARIFREAGADLQAGWRENAERTAGNHGRLYPRSITTDVRISTDIVIEVGPDPALPQGGMSFEFGSINQPAHLDGQIAADVVERRLPRRIEDGLTDLGL